MFITSCLYSNIRDVYVACSSGLGIIRRIDWSKKEQNQSKNELSQIISLKTTKSNKQKSIRLQRHLNPRPQNDRCIR